jgi:hypothetical protein
MANQKSKRTRTAGLLLFSCFLFCGAADHPADFRESGEYKIYAAGKEIGIEKYAILASGDTVSTNSTVEFRNPENARQKVHLETNLETDGRFVPRSYTLKSDVDGKKGTIMGEFGPNQVMFGYIGPDGTPLKRGLLVGDEYTLLDTNVFHHFVFLARLFHYDAGKGKPQRFQVVIPQEQETGFLNVVEADKESLRLHGKKVETRRLQLDSGSVQIQLWVDNQRVVQKIAVPGRGIEVVRSP